MLKRAAGVEPAQLGWTFGSLSAAAGGTHAHTAFRAKGRLSFVHAQDPTAKSVRFLQVCGWCLWPPGSCHISERS